VENLSLPERYQKALNAGVDIFSGSADPSTLIETVKKGLISEARINVSVAKLLTEKFELGLFENPYVNVDEAVNTIGKKNTRKRRIWPCGNPLCWPEMTKKFCH